MIKQETIDIGGTEFRRTYSDEGVKVQKVGTDERYADAIDVLDSPYQYIETDEPVEESLEGEGTPE